MDRITQKYIDKLAQSTYENINLQVQVESLKMENDKLREELEKVKGQKKKTNKEGD